MNKSTLKLLRAYAIDKDLPERKVKNWWNSLSWKDRNRKRLELETYLKKEEDGAEDAEIIEEEVLEQGAAK